MHIAEQIAEAIERAWPDPMGQWTADQADAAAAMKRQAVKIARQFVTDDAAPAPEPEPTVALVTVDAAAADVARARSRVAEEIATEIETTIGGYPDNEVKRPKVERGGHLNDAQWAAQIARSKKEGSPPTSRRAADPV